MRFTFVDRVTELQPGVKIVTVKCLTLAEECLADHFPRFAVMPGVLMLQAMTEAGAWLVRASEDFAHSMVLLKEARNVKYTDFVQPGQRLTITAEIVKSGERETQIKATGLVEDKTAVSGRLVLERFNLAERQSELATVDQYVKRQMKEQLSLLWQSAGESAALMAK